MTGPRGSGFLKDRKTGLMLAIDAARAEEDWSELLILTQQIISIEAALRRAEIDDDNSGTH